MDNSNKYIYGPIYKAFDTLIHEILISKLKHYGVRGEAIDLIRSYLYQRQQLVEFNGCLSRGVCRISQGGGGPTLKFLGLCIYMPRSCEPLLGGFGGMPPKKIFKNGAISCVLRTIFNTFMVKNPLKKL